MRIKIGIAALMLAAGLTLPQTSFCADVNEEIRGETAKLLEQLDGFRDSAIFKKCVYGCGAENPGRAWNEARKTFQEYVEKNGASASIYLRMAPANLFQLGKAYATNNEADIRLFRGDIENALKN